MGLPWARSVWHGGPMTERLTRELASFDGVWAGGYFEGDPRDPMARSSFGQLGYMSVLHATYLACIKPYVRDDTVALEIGPGRGAWTKSLLPAREVWAVDALSAEHNGFFEYLGHPDHVRYFQVDDFSLRELPAARFTYMFSFGALCHVSFDGITAYAASAFDKLRPGAECFWMVADYAKYNAAVEAVEHLSPWTRCVSPRPRYAPARALLRALARVDAPRTGCRPTPMTSPPPRAGTTLGPSGPARCSRTPVTGSSTPTWASPTATR